MKAWGFRTQKSSKFMPYFFVFMALANIQLESVTDWRTKNVVRQM
jgi:hypothetical protein